MEIVGIGNSISNPEDGLHHRPSGWDDHTATDGISLKAEGTGLACEIWALRMRNRCNGRMENTGNVIEGGRVTECGVAEWNMSGEEKE